MVQQDESKILNLHPLAIHLLLGWYASGPVTMSRARFILL